MSVSFKFDDLNFTTHLSVSDIKGRERVFLLIEGTDDWFEMYQCRGVTPTILYDFGVGLDGGLSINGRRLFNRFKHAFKDFVESSHNWFTSEFGFKGLPTCKPIANNYLSVIGLKTQRYVNGDELVLEWVDEVVDPVDEVVDPVDEVVDPVDEVVDPVDASIRNLHTTHDRAFGTSTDIHGCSSCSMCCKTPVGSVCALPTLSNVAVPVYQETSVNWLSSVSSPNDTMVTYRLIMLDEGQKFPPWCKLSHNNEEAKRQQSRITVMQDKHGRPIPLLKVPYDLKNNSLVSLSGLEPLARTVSLPRAEDISLYEVVCGYITLSDMLKGATCTSELAFIKWNSENNLNLPMFR